MSENLNFKCCHFDYPCFAILVFQDEFFIIFFAEMITGGESYAKSDLWAAGIITYEMLYGQSPFFSVSVASTKWNILNRDLVWPEAVSSEAKDLISRMLTKDPEARITFNEVLHHPWLTKL